MGSDRDEENIVVSSYYWDVVVFSVVNGVYGMGGYFEDVIES